MDKERVLNELQLVNLARGGDSQAYSQLVMAYGSKIELMLHVSINDKTAVYDLKQDVLFKIFKYLPNFNEQCQFSTWIYRITENTVKNYYRLIEHRKSLEENYAIALSTVTRDYSPELDSMCLEMSSRISSAIKKLPRDLRKCYQLNALEGYTYEAIAKKLKCPIGTVRSRIHRAKKILNNYLGN